MSEITLALLAGTNAAGFTEASDAWARMAAGLDAGLDRFAAASQYLPAVWPTGEAAQDRVAALRAELSNAHAPCKNVSRALRTHADTILSLQSMLADIQGECAAEGITVDLTTATVSAHDITDTAQAARVAGLVQSYTRQLAELLTRARSLDLETVVALAELPPTAGTARTGPGITKDDVARMRGKSSQEVRAWWGSLTRDQQDQAIRDFPREVGWLDGVPAGDRDKANRIGLAQHKQYLKDRYENPDMWAEQDETLNELDRVETIEQGLDKLGARGFLLGFDTAAYAGDGKLVVAMGDPDTARNTGVWVPGLGTTLGNTDGNIDRILAMNRRADALTPQAGDVSTVYWLGYDTPDFTNTSVLQNGRSLDARDPYLNFMQGLRATHDSDVGHLVAMGHSYGTTVLGEAAATHQLPVDDIVVAGSPGMHVPQASDLMADPRHVWAGASPGDPVPRAGALLDPFNAAVPPTITAERLFDAAHGLAPTEQGFGANVWQADTKGHTHYWDEDSESLMNQSRVLAGAYDQVTLNGGTAPENWR
ncbi:alpha/beta hydrolase [Actinoplanes awajinensis]|uniref:DUF1023 domain-containing protein n=1 Tax=Actinoplanes awajinensis subsp. mycoplanecinus TaxID=135947 RepID=A0A124GA93_9ACTN|nr:alpha/beta hydrolase [Actinoplanes awajinensis]KUL31527.1 hypothetical protein ADL15_21910 [Actinoplanes awajinensis subsp. mycoplanecinus]